MPLLQQWVVILLWFQQCEFENGSWISYFFVFRFISVEVSDRNQNDFIQLFHFSDFLFLVSIIFMYIYKERIIEGQIFYTGLIVSFMIISYK